MTIIEAINNVDALLPNTYTQSEKVKWLSTLDGLLKIDVFDLYKADEAAEFTGYNDETPTDTVLLVGEPYDEIYTYWLMARIHFFNGDTSKYNNMITMYNDTLTGFSDSYNRNHEANMVDSINYW